jgi:hypothetical protein
MITNDKPFIFGRITMKIVIFLLLSALPWWPMEARAIELLTSCSTHGVTVEEVSHATGIIRAFLGKDLDTLEKTNGRKAQIEIQSADLDGDGTPEILARIYHSGYCGSAGCMILVLQKNSSGEWKPLFTATSENIEVGGTRKTGMCDLILRDDRGRQTIFRWSGRKYKALKNRAMNRPARTSASQR